MVVLKINIWFWFMAHGIRRWTLDGHTMYWCYWKKKNAGDFTFDYMQFSFTVCHFLYFFIFFFIFFWGGALIIFLSIQKNDEIFIFACACSLSNFPFDLNKNNWPWPPCEFDLRVGVQLTSRHYSHVYKMVPGEERGDTDVNAELANYVLVLINKKCWKCYPWLYAVFA